MLNKKQLKIDQKNDYLQTRVREPRLLPPNFALYCDWIIWDGRHLHVDNSVIPKTVYVRSEVGTLNYFVFNVLPKIKNDFVLITSSHDTPMPIGFQKSFGFKWDVIVNNQFLKAWFTENRDLLHEKIKPIPLGLPHPDLPSWLEGEQLTTFWTKNFFEEVKRYKKKKRIFKIFGCWYPRDNHPSGTCPLGDNERQDAFDTLIEKQEIFDWYPPGMDRLKFTRKMGSYQFVLCPHGGGFDPNPKCWEALIMGAIPIVRRSSMSESLEHLPVAMVDDWTEITPHRLAQWKDGLQQRVQDPCLKHLMSNKFFFRKILDCLD
jgi:hypothetical protein